MKISCVIPSLYHVDGSYLKLCVDSLRESGFTGDIIVVTNGTKNKPGLNHIKGITKHIHTSAQGQCQAVNIGAQLVSGDTDYIMVSNSDMYYAKGWDLNIRFDYPVFSPNLVEPEDNPGSATPFRKLDAGYTLDKFKKELVDTFVNDVVLTLRDKQSEETGFNLPFFIRKDLWDMLKGYDIAYDPWGSNSDTDLQTRINLAGVIPMRLTNMLVYHFSNKSGTFDGTHQDYYQNNIDYFRDKFGFDRDELGSDVWYNKDMIPTDESKIKYKQRKYDINNT
jgi:GT2 family glycosyltransferase